MTIKIDTDIELRQLGVSDSNDIFEAIDNQREYLGKWLPFVEHTKELIDTQNFVESAVCAPEDTFEYIFTIRKHNKFIGIIGFKDTDWLNKRTEMGYWLCEQYQKQGIVTKSVAKLCDFAFDTQGLNRIQIKCAVENYASNKIPPKLGFKLEGTERDGELLTGNVYTDLNVYSKLKRDRE